MGFITDFLREIDENIKGERMFNAFYKKGLKDREVYEHAEKYIRDMYSDYKDVRIEGCFMYGVNTHIKFSYTSVFGIRLKKEIVIMNNQTLIKRLSDDLTKDLKFNYEFWRKCFNDDKKEVKLLECKKPKLLECKKP